MPISILNFEVHGSPRLLPSCGTRIVTKHSLLFSPVQAVGNNFSKHRCRSKQILGGAKDFCLNFPKLARKVVVRLLPKNFISQRLLRPFLVRPPKKGLNFFFANVGRHFLKSNNVGRHFFPEFQGFCPNFLGFCPGFFANQNFWGCGCTPASYTTVSKSMLHRLVYIGLLASLTVIQLCRTPIN